MRYLVSLTMLLLFISCAEDEPEFPTSLGGGVGSGWSVPQGQIFDGGPGKDGIPAIDNPETVAIGSTSLDYLADDDLVLVYKDRDEIKAYTHAVLNWHEIINDEIGSEYVAVTYCPLTGTGIGWGREINAEVTTFGVSGLLYETNLIPYDRLTDSNWSQMLNECINGTLQGRAPDFFNVIQMNYGALKAMLPNALVTTTNTGHNRRYDQYPYGSYREDENFLFPISNLDDRLHPKELVRGVAIDGQAIAFRFPESGTREVYSKTFADEELIVVADESMQFIVSFLNIDIDGTPLIFSPIDNSESAFIMQDQFGNKWDIFGKAIQGPNAGRQLEVPHSYIGFWFAWGTFYPDIELYDGTN